MSEVRSRHGCLTAWLALMVIANSAMATVYLLGGAAIYQLYSSAPTWAFPVLGVAGLGNVVCSIALLRWKKWGFFGFIASSALAFAANLMIGVPTLQTLFGLAGIAVLYGFLQIGKEKKAWTQLN